MATEDTYDDGGEDDVRGRCEDGVGEVATAWVCARVEERIMIVVRRAFIGTWTTQFYYTGAPGGSHLKDTWLSCNTSEVVPRSHARLDCQVVVPASPGFR